MDGDPFGLLGTVLDGKFCVDTPVGDGDLSVVYKGFHLGLHGRRPGGDQGLHLSPTSLDPRRRRALWSRPSRTPDSCRTDSDEAAVMIAQTPRSGRDDRATQTA